MFTVTQEPKDKYSKGINYSLVVGRGEIRA